jgi:vitamin B12 transporter
VIDLFLPIVLAVAPVWAAEEGDDEMVVTDTRPDPADRFADPTSVTVIEIDARLPHSADVADALHQVAGARVVHLGGLGDFSAVGLRGASLRQVQIFLDGVPLNPDGSQTINLSELPLHAFERIEVYRGNAPAVYAAAPIGGVVDLVTADRLPPGSVSATLGSHHTARVSGMGGIATTIRKVPTDLLLFSDVLATRGDYRYFSDNGTPYNMLDDARPIRDNNNKGQMTIHGRWRLGTERLRLTVLDAFLDRGEGLPGHVNNPTTDSRLDTRRNLFVTEVSGRTGPVRVKGHGWMQHRRETYDDRGDELGIGVQHLVQRSNNAGALGHAQWAATSWMVPGITASVRRDGFRAEDLLAARESAAQTRIAGVAAANADLFLGRWTAVPVVQLTTVHNRWDEADAPQFLSVDPRLGIAWQPRPALMFRANGGHYLRPPDLSELFGDRGAMVGNPTLRPERGWQWDVGGRGQLGGDWGDALVDVAHFWLASEDLVSYVQNSQRTLRPVNLGRTWVQGLELATTLDLWGHLDSQTSGTWTLSRNLDTDPAVANKQLPRVPTLSLWQGTSVHWGEQVRLGHTWSWTDGNYWDATNWFRSAPRSLHGVFLRGQPTPRWPAIEIAVRNLFDKTVEVVPRNPLNAADDARVVQPLTDFVGYPLPGRTVLLTVRWTAQQGRR